MACSICGQKGHNKTKCPHVSEEQRKELSIRRCGYCREEGHTRLKCKALKEDLKGLHDYERLARSAMKSLMIEKGVGAGTIVSLTKQWPNQDPNLRDNYIISHIEWSKILFKDASRSWGSVNSIILKKFEDKSIRRVALRLFFGTSDFLRIIVPLSERQVEIQIPSNWESIVQIEDRYFETYFNYKKRERNTLYKWWESVQFSSEMQRRTHIVEGLLSVENYPCKFLKTNV
jgi:hypothetical protein